MKLWKKLSGHNADEVGVGQSNQAFTYEEKALINFFNPAPRYHGHSNVILAAVGPSFDAYQNVKTGIVECVEKGKKRIRANVIARFEII